MIYLGVLLAFCGIVVTVLGALGHSHGIVAVGIIGAILGVSLVIWMLSPSRDEENDDDYEEG